MGIPSFPGEYNAWGLRDTNLRHLPVAIFGSHGIVLRGARPEPYYGGIALLHGLNGSVPDPVAVDSREGRPPAGVTVYGSSTLTGSVPRF